MKLKLFFQTRYFKTWLTIYHLHPASKYVTFTLWLGWHYFRQHSISKNGMILHVFKKITYHYCTIFSITNLLFYRWGTTLICLIFRFYLENWSKATMGNKLPLLWFGLQGYLIKSGGGGTTSVLLRKTNFFICHQFDGKKTLWLMIIFF